MFLQVRETGIDVLGLRPGEYVADSLLLSPFSFRFSSYCFSFSCGIALQARKVAYGPRLSSLREVGIYQRIRFCCSF